MTESQAQDECQSSIRAQPLVLPSREEKVELQQGVLPAPPSRQRDASCPLPMAFRRELVLLEALEDELGPVRCFQG